MCLLKNQDNLLPLKKGLKRILVLGPNANIARLGDYTEAATEGSEFGMLNQIKKSFRPKQESSFLTAKARKFTYAPASGKLYPSKGNAATRECGVQTANGEWSRENFRSVSEAIPSCHRIQCSR